ncbi:MAG: von Willebrand factor type A domain-containing protein [Myxococcota bacterium]|jgi:Ca-activated chloride channel family protein|nr:von Willebrand factor type A domain-containing protein [Myxococcota bacterium]
MKYVALGVWSMLAAGILASAGCGMDDASDSANLIDTSGGSYDEDFGAPATNEGDKYEAVGTNPFVLTAHDPFSTFAADVDSASYDIFRRDISSGILPHPASVRLEEFVNYFHYDYPAPSVDAEHPFSITVSAAPGLFDRDTSLLRVAIAAENPPPSEKKPANLVFLIDTSGSMSDENKLPLVQHLLVKALDVLEPGDRVSIVTYAGFTGLALGSTDVENKAVIEEAIESFTAQGSTAGAAGIDLAYEQAAAGFIQGGINHIILCTDGDFNVGPYTDQELVSLIEEKRDSGVTLTVLGFGRGNLNDSMMEKLSNAGNGNYAVISGTKQADDYVENRLLGNLVVVAKDMKIQVEFNPEHVFAYRLLGYENRAIADEDFTDDTVDAGEVGAGHRVTALYEIVPEGKSIPMVVNAPEIEDGEPEQGEREVGEQELVLVKVRYKSPEAQTDDPAFAVSASLSSGALRDELSQADADFQYAVAVAAFAEILKESPYAAPGALEQISEILAQQSFADPQREELKNLFETASSLLSR